MSEGSAAQTVSAERFLAGDSAAVAAVSGWVRLALAPFRFRLREEVDDLAQQAQLELCIALRRAKGEPTELRAFVWRVTVRSAIDRLRSRSRWRFQELGDLASPSQAAPLALENLLREESRTLLVRLLAELPRACRDLFQQLFAGLSYSEMARQAGVRDGTLRVRVLRCRRRALALARRGNDGDDGAPNSKGTLAEEIE